MRFVALALVVSAGLAEAGSPLSKVIELLKDLKATVISEGETEQKNYNKYACWCRETTHRKIEFVEQGKETYETLTTTILSKTAEVKHSTAMIEESDKRLEANNAMVEEKSAKRKSEMEAYMTNRAELVEAIDALHKAIGVLSDPTKARSFVDISKVLRSSVAEAHQLAMDEQKAVLLRKFIQAPEEFYQTGAKYTPQSGSISGILRDMYRQFAIQLQTESSDEMNLQFEHEDLMNKLQRERADLDATKVHHETKRSKANEALADATTQREETHAAIKAAQVFFKQTVDGCHAKASEWNVRRAQRNDEIDAITKSMAVLTEDGNEELFGKSLGNKAAGTAFLQLSSSETHIERSAYRVLSATARNAKSVRVASIAAMLQTSGDFSGKGGHFDTVIKKVNGMIHDLDAEAAKDKVDFKQCQDDRARLNREMTEANNNAEREQTRMDREQSLADKAQRAIDKATEEQNENEEARKEANTDFNDAKAANEEAISNDEKAIAVVRRAIEELARFYKCGSNSKSLLQRGSQPDSLRNEDSEAQGAVFSDKFSNCAGGGTILSMMQQIVQDMIRDVKDARTAIADDTAANTKMNAASDDTDNGLAAFISDQSEKKAAHMGEYNAADKENGREESASNAAQAGLDGIKKDCDFIIDFFQHRREHRATEKKGLQEAMHILSTGGSTR